LLMTKARYLNTDLDLTSLLDLPRLGLCSKKTDYLRTNFETRALPHHPGNPQTGLRVYLSA
jgi:hypothetical protein